MDLKREILMVNCADMDQPTPDNSWGSTGALSCGKRFENVVGIRLLKHNLNGMTALVYVPEWAPYCVGSYAYKPEITVRQGVQNANSTATLQTINQRIPEYLTSNNNYYVLQCSNFYVGSNSTYVGIDDVNLLVAEVNNREAPFHFDRVSHAVWIISNDERDTRWGYHNVVDLQFSHTYLNNVSMSIAGDGTSLSYKQPGWDSSIYQNNRGSAVIRTFAAEALGTNPPFFVYEIIMVDETSHIARMPNADQLAIEYKDKVEQTGRYKTNAAEINKAISAFKSFSK